MESQLDEDAWNVILVDKNDESKKLEITTWWWDSHLQKCRTLFGYSKLLLFNIIICINVVLLWRLSFFNLLLCSRMHPNNFIISIIVISDSPFHKPWTPKIISGRPLVLRPIRCAMKLLIPLFIQQFLLCRNFFGKLSNSLPPPPKKN